MQSQILTSFTVLVLALLIDFLLGDPPEKIHPTMWIGKTIAFFKPHLRSKNPWLERLNGVLLGLFTIMVFTISFYFVLSLVKLYLSFLVYVIVAAILLKTTFAIKCMERLTLPVAEAVQQGDIDRARRSVSRVVGRDTTNLSEQKVLSAAVETISEGTVDGITSPLFFFSLFGVLGAVAFRVISTLDSMVAYKDPENINVGWFSAKLDTLANYIPSRITAFLMIVVAWLTHENCEGARRILLRDRNKTESLNAGWPMSTMAGALNVRLEKKGFYVLGEGNVTLSPDHVLRALRIMKLTTYLFVALIIMPLLILSITITA